LLWKKDAVVGCTMVFALRTNHGEYCLIIVYESDILLSGKEEVLKALEKGKVIRKEWSIWD